MKSKGDAKRFRQLFNESLSEFGSKFKTILKSFLFIYFIPIFILGGILLAFMVVSYPGLVDGVSSGVTAFNFFQTGMSITFIIFTILFAVVFVVLTLFLNISYIYIALSKKNNLSFSEIFGVARKFFWKYLCLTIILVVFLIILYVLLIIPGIIFTVFWVFASFILIKENTSAWEAMKRSKQIVKGRWWGVFGFGLLLVIIAIIVSLIFDVIPFVGSFVSNFIMLPFAIIFLKNFYFNLKENMK